MTDPRAPYGESGNRPFLFLYGPFGPSDKTDRNTMSKTIISLLMALAAVLANLVSCGGDPLKENENIPLPENPPVEEECTTAYYMGVQMLFEVFESTLKNDTHRK